MERAIAEKLPSVRLNFSLTWLLGLVISDLFFNLNSTQTQVQFEVADATKRMFPDCSFDVIYSRDTILHIDNKPALFKRFHVSISGIYSSILLVFCDISILFSPGMVKTRWQVTHQWLLLWRKTLDTSFWDLCQTERLHSLHTPTVWQGTTPTEEPGLMLNRTVSFAQPCEKFKFIN